MFIPRGIILHENLATSYVLVDSLVADLCEGGFSGVVEVLLRRSDAHVILARGRVAAIVLARHPESPDAATEYSRTTVAQVAAAAGQERGRVSVYRYSAENAEAIGGRIVAEALYTRLSTEFADLEKVIAKLSRESDRQWFIEIEMTSGLAVLIHIKSDGCRVLTARDGALRETHESRSMTENPALAAIYDESHLMGGVFDVYFRSATAALPSEEVLATTLSRSSGDLPSAALNPAVAASTAANAEPDRAAADTGDVSDVVREARAVFQSLSLDETDVAPPERSTPARGLSVSPEAASALREINLSMHEPLNHEDAADDIPQAAVIEDDAPSSPLPPPSVSADDVGLFPQIDEMAYQVTGDRARAVGADLDKIDEILDIPPATNPGQQAATTPARRSTRDLLMMPDDLRATGLLKRGSQADVLAEIKRLMGEILRTVEEAIRAAGSRDGFTMHLRAGQLKVADHYPFLDPFGSEFEFLAGEIVFVGDVTADEFIFGLSEALQQAIESAAQASPQPARIRSHTVEGLRWLLNRQRAELELYHLDQSLETIIAENQAAN